MRAEFRSCRRVLSILCACGALLGVAGCSKSGETKMADAGAATQNGEESTMQPRSRGAMGRPKAPPATSSPTADAAPLHNLHEVVAGLISGAQPEGDAAFAELTRRGVKVIISVDGAPPDLERAKAHGFRYVHIPCGYDGISPAQRLQLAKAVATADGTVYVHCHHGKHRGPTAAALAAISLGRMNPTDGTAFLKLAGTAPNYTGLYACIEHAYRVDASALRSADIVLVERAKPAGLIEAMLVIDDAFDHLGLIEKAGWKAPAGHPDLVPAAEAARLADALRDILAAQRDGKLTASHRDRLLQSPRVGGRTFTETAADAHAAAQELENAITTGEPATALKPKWELVSQSCRDCHRAYRD